MENQFKLIHDNYFPQMLTLMEAHSQDPSHLETVRNNKKLR